MVFFETLVAVIGAVVGVVADRSCSAITGAVRMVKGLDSSLRRLDHKLKSVELQISNLDQDHPDKIRLSQTIEDGKELLLKGKQVPRIHIWKKWRCAKRVKKLEGVLRDNLEMLSSTGSAGATGAVGAAGAAGAVGAARAVGAVGAAGAARAVGAAGAAGAVGAARAARAVGAARAARAVGPARAAGAVGAAGTAKIFLAGAIYFIWPGGIVDIPV